MFELKISKWTFLLICFVCRSEVVMNFNFSCAHFLVLVCTLNEGVCDISGYWLKIIDEV
ncbi:hypothetical protein BYT27DRAFT_6795023, partial [Phlegmacium glaucopus]